MATSKAPVRGGAGVGDGERNHDYTEIGGMLC